MQTFKLKIKNKIDISNYLEQYSYCFRQLYKNVELFSDKSFNKEINEKYNLLDSWFIQSCKMDVKAKKDQLITFNNRKQELILELEDILNKQIYKDKKHKYKIINKIAFLKRSNKKDLTFGGKELLTRLTKEKQKSNIKNYEKFLKQYKENRILSIYSIGEEPKNSNRKFIFDFKNNKVIFKPAAKTKIELEYYCGNNQKKTLNQLQNFIGKIPISVRLNNEYIWISFDEEKLNNYNFKENEYFREVKNISKDNKEERKIIYKKYIKEQEDRKYKNKLKDRYCAIDLNPEYIGLSIVDKLNDNGDFNIIYKQCFNLTNLNTKLKLSSTDLKQIKQNNKRKYEIKEIYKYIFNLCIHYKVGNFVIEDLNFKIKDINNKDKSFNRKTKNLWYRTLAINLINKYCNSLGINKIEVNPAYSSFIGNLIYNDFDPIASSLELNRRGIIKFIKNNKQFGNIDSINLQKVSYLVGENVQLENFKSIPKLFKLFSEQKLKYRNPIENIGFKEKFLKSKKSKFRLYV